ncbi:MAG: aldo/keto reductase [Spirochaetaceae bacterium]|jgi:diketogulonate reductase-like aldo/keto reductase|nr:aldo/keto reductase [Spirochaetaceae bacterium]
MKFTDLNSCYELSNGVKVPCIGFGTWQVKEPEVCAASVSRAIEAGYRHIDTAAAYHNEDSVGRGIHESGVPRSELFIASKVHNNMHGYKNTLSAFEQSINELGTDYLDLYLIHWPNPVKYRDDWALSNAETWRAFEELYAAGKIRALGISNFRQHHIEPLLKNAKTAPHVNQIRICPGEYPAALISYCRERNMLLEAYSPLGTGKTFEVPELKRLAEKYGRSIAQICVRWNLQNGCLPLPKSVTPERVAENARVFDFEIDEAGMRLIDALEGCCEYSRDPDAIEF